MTQQIMLEVTSVDKSDQLDKGGEIFETKTVMLEIQGNPDYRLRLRGSPDVIDAMMKSYGITGPGDTLEIALLPSSQQRLGVEPQNGQPTQ